MWFKPGYMVKKYFSLSFLFLLVGNFYCIYYFSTNKDSFDTIIWIYWMQSVIIGLFHFLDLLTLKDFDPTGFKFNNQQVQPGKNGCVALFFLIHYGIFHLVYGIFLSTRVGLSGINFHFLLLGIAAFLMESFIDFLHKKRVEQQIHVKLGLLFSLPYLRIIPMHVFIMIPVLAGNTGSIVFLLLKFVADILSYIAYQRVFRRSLENR